MTSLPDFDLSSDARTLSRRAGCWGFPFERTRMAGLLFEPVEFGSIELPNRIVMAPLTRARAGRDAVPTPMMAEYYAQRASAGLIISEATGITREGLGWPNAPGLWKQT